MIWSRRSKQISLGRTCSNHRCFGRAGRNVSRLVDFGRKIELCGRADRNISRLVELGRNVDVLVARVETYLAWSNLVELGRNINVLVAPVETYLAWSNLVET